MIKPIKNEQQYNEALESIYCLMQKDLEPNSMESDELEILSILVKEYEHAYYPVPKPTPLEAIKFRMEQMNMSEAELSKILGARSRKSEVLSGKRKLSLAMIRRIADSLKISADVLIQA